MAKVAYIGEPYNKGMIGSDLKSYPIALELPFHIIFGNMIVEKSGLVPRPYKRFYDSFNNFSCPPYMLGEYSDTIYNSYVYLYSYYNKRNIAIPLGGSSIAGNRGRDFYFDVNTNTTYALFSPFNSSSYKDNLYSVKEEFGYSFEVINSANLSDKSVAYMHPLLFVGGNIYVPVVQYYVCSDRLCYDILVKKFDSSLSLVNTISIYSVNAVYGFYPFSYLGQANDKLIFLFGKNGALSLAFLDTSDDSLVVKDLPNLDYSYGSILQGALLNYDSTTNTYTFALVAQENDVFNLYKVDYNAFSDSFTVNLVDAGLVNMSSGMTINDKSILEFRVDSVDKGDSVYIFVFTCNKLDSDGGYATSFTDDAGNSVSFIGVYKYSKTTQAIQKVAFERFNIPVSVAVCNKDFSYAKFSSLEGTVDVSYDFNADSLVILGYSVDKYKSFVRDEFDRIWGFDTNGYLEMFGKKVPYRVEKYIQVSSNIWNGAVVDGNVVVNVYDDLGNRVEADVVLTIPNPSAVTFDDGSVQKVVTTSTTGDTLVPIKIYAPTGIIVGVSVKCIR